MSSPDPTSFDESLLEMHLGRLGPAESARLMQQVAADPALARQHEALTAVFAALNSIRNDDVPAPGLVERVQARVAAAPQLRVVPAADRPRREWTQRVWQLRDVIAVAAMVVLVVGLGTPALLQVRERGQRVACSANLARLGQGLAAYATAFNDSLPFAGWGSRASWAPSPAADYDVIPNRRHVYRLLPNRTVQPGWFVCPSTHDVPMAADQVARNNDFTESRNISYSYQNMAGVRPALHDSPDMPILADNNPIFDDGRPLYDLRYRLGLSDPADANSRAHGGTGQNILTLGGRVRWVTTPNAGINGDNIWTLHGVRSYSGREGPQATTDSHLLK